MNAEGLKNSILQLAIQGKLVEQREEEGTAEELYKQIHKEKIRKVKEKKIRRRKKLDKINAEEIPFDIPETWKWVRLDDIAYSIRAGGDKPKVFSEEKTEANVIPVIANGVTNNGVVGYTDTSTAESPAITISGRGTIGYSSIRREPFCPIVRLLVVHLVSDINLEFLQIALSRLLEVGVGTSIKQLTVPMIRPKLIPLPPLEEQKRIVAKIEELMPYVEQYGEAYEKVTELNKQFPTEMEKSILQYAIQGKLVEQREEEGTAAELYEEIQMEKERLIEAGTIRRQQKLPDITEEEIPFDIPETWKWVKLGNVCNYGSNQSVKASEIPNDAWLLELEDIEKDTGVILQRKTMEEVNIKSNRNVFMKGNVLYSKLRPYLNKVVIADQNGYTTTEILPLNFGSHIYNKYAQVVLMSPYFIHYTISCSYGVKMPRLGTKDGRNALFPLPPLKEQKRIVAKIEELFTYTKRLINE